MPSIESIVLEYLTVFPDEHKRLVQLNDLVRDLASDNGILARQNFVGHVTASGFVISRSSLKVLLVYHKGLRRFLQPGGHFEPGELSPLEVALREVREETSLSSLEYIPYHLNSEVPIDIDSHFIPENKARNEPAHWHHDFRYLFFVDEGGRDPTIDLNTTESSGYEWVDINELSRQQTFMVVTSKIRRALSKEFRPKMFYERLGARLSIDRRVNTIAVAHFIPDVIPYVEALDRVSNVIALLAKPRSMLTEIDLALQSRFRVEKASRDLIQDSDLVEHLVESAGEDVVLLDIGGYFAPVIEKLDCLFPGCILGVVEDTENGHQKYAAQSHLPVPVFSVARSPLKASEDFLVGQSILFSADAILRECGKLIQYMDCSVLGYGKIGRSIAHHLLMRGCRPRVFDTNPIRRVDAHTHLCSVTNLDTMLGVSDVLFCATGNHSLDIFDFRRLKPGCFVFSVTSSDDEMDLRYLDSEYSAEQIGPFVAKYSSFSNHFYLVNNGNAVNFIHGAVLGDFIHMVRGEMLCAVKTLVADGAKPGLHELGAEHRQTVAELWMRTFVDEQARYSDLSLAKHNFSGLGRMAG